MCKIYLFLDLALGLALLSIGIYIIAISSRGGDQNFAIILIFCALFFLFSSAGFALRSFWMVLFFSLPVIFVSTVFGFMILIGGWIWGPNQIATMYTFVGSAILCIIFQLTGIVAAFQVMRSTKGKDDQS